MSNLVDAQIVAEYNGSATVKAFARDLRDVKPAAMEAAQGGSFFQKAFEFATGGAIVSAVGGIIEKFGELKDGLIGGNAEFEQYNTRFKVLLGSAEAAKQRMNELADFGQKTPFDLPQVVKADTILQGFGLHSQEAAQKFGFSGDQIRTIAGDVASGTGASFEEMSTLIGKFSSGATGEAISRMQELGITNRDELTKMGLQFSKSGELMSPLPQAMNVVLAQMQKKYGGLMDAQSSTFEGMMSNLDDWKAGTLRKLGAPIFDVLKNQLGNLLQFLGSPEVQSTIDNVANALAGGIGTTMDFISKTVIPAFQAGWANLQPVLQNVWNAVQPVVKIFADLGIWLQTGFNMGGLEGALAFLGGWAEQVKIHLSDLGQKFVSWASEAIPPLLAQLGQIGGQILGWIQQQAPGILQQLLLWDVAFQSWVTEMIPPFLAKVNELSGQLLDWIGQQVPPLLGQLAEWGSSFIQWIAPMVPPFLERLGTIAGALIEFVASQAGVLIEHLGAWGEALIGWIAPRLPGMVEQLQGLLSAFGTWASTTALPAIAEKMSVWGAALADWAGRVWNGENGQPGLSVKLGMLLGALGDWAVNNALPAIVNKLGEWISAFVKWAGDVWTGSGKGGGLQDKLGDLLSSIGTWIVKTAAPAALEKAKELGASVISGIAAGIDAGVKGLLEKVGGVAQQVWDKVSSVWRTGSPSKEFYKLGVWGMQGLGLGIEAGATYPLTAVEGVASQTLARTGTIFDPGATPSGADAGIGTGTGGGFATFADPVAQKGLDWLAQQSLAYGGRVLSGQTPVAIDQGDQGTLGGGSGSTTTANSGSLSFEGNDQTAVASNAGMSMEGADTTYAPGDTTAAPKSSTPTSSVTGQVMQVAAQSVTLTATTVVWNQSGQPPTTTPAGTTPGADGSDQTASLQGGQWAKYAAANPANQRVQDVIGVGPRGSIITPADVDRMDIDHANAVMAGTGAMNLPQEVDQHKENVVEGGRRLAEYLNEGFEQGFGQGLVYKLLAILGEELDKEHARTVGGGV